MLIVHNNFKTKEIVTESTQVFNSFLHQYHTMEHYLQKHSSTLTRTNLFKWPQQSPFTFRAPCRIHYHKRSVSPLNEFLVVIRYDVGRHSGTLFLYSSSDFCLSGSGTSGDVRELSFETFSSGDFKTFVRQISPRERGRCWIVIFCDENSLIGSRERSRAF